MKKKPIFIPQKQFLESQQNTLVTKPIVFFRIDGAFLVDFLYTIESSFGSKHCKSGCILKTIQDFFLDFDILLST